MTFADKSTIATNVVDAVIGDARAFVAGLDRSVLGVFAVPERALLLATLDNMYMVMARDDQTGTFLQYSNAAVELLFTEFPSIDEDAYDEMFYWIKILGIDSMINRVRSRVESIHYYKLFLVGAHSPVVHTYFKVGIWNVDFIERCIATGVDPDMAMALAGKVDRIVPGMSNELMVYIYGAALASSMTGGDGSGF